MYKIAIGFINNLHIARLQIKIITVVAFSDISNIKISADETWFSFFSNNLFSNLFDISIMMMNAVNSNTR